MKLGLKTKKRLVIAMLAVGVIGFSSGLLGYMKALNNGVPANVETVTELMPEESVTVQAILLESERVEAETAVTMAVETSTASVTADTETESAASRETVGETMNPTTVGVVKVPETSRARVRTPEEAAPPAEPPVSQEAAAPVENPDADGVCQPDHTEPAAEVPQGGSSNSEGAVYVPGFGYVEPSGTVEGSTSYSDGDWNKQIGTME